MEYKGYAVIARASQLPAGHYKARYAVYATTSGGAHEVVYQGVIASPDYDTPAVAEAQATRAAQGWIDTQARKHSLRTIRRQRFAGVGVEILTVEPHTPIGFAYG